MENKKKNIWDRLKKPSWPVRIARMAVISLAGMPVVSQMMSFIPGDPLPPAEIVKLREVFNDTVDYDKVRINHSGFSWFYNWALKTHATSFGNKILVGERPEAGPDELADYEMMHEMTHVWQRQHDGLTSLRAEWQSAMNYLTTHDRMALYEYTLEPGKKLQDYTIEQQAGIVADYYNIKHDEVPVMLKYTGLKDAERDQRYRAVLNGFFKPQTG